MSSIFVIEQGSYSDYHVVGVYSSKQNAEKAILHIESNYDKPSIAEWPLDPNVEQINQGLMLWMVRMAKDGASSNAERQKSSYSIGTTSKYQFPHFDARGRLMAEIWAESSEAAIKIMSERRRQAIAEGKL